MATAVSTQLSALTGANTIEQMMGDVNSLKTLSALATDAAGSGDFVPTTGGTFTGQIIVNKSGFNSVTISGDSTSETQLRFDTNTAARISNQSETDLIFATNATEYMRIDSDGDVDIGTASPINGGRYLDITNTNGVATDFSILRLITQQVGSSSTTSADLYKRKNGQLTLSNNDTDSAAHLTLQVGASERMRIDSAGKIGIGTTSPAEKLHIAGGSTTGALIVSESTSTSQYSGGGIALMNGATSNDSHVLINTSIRDSDGSDSTLNINKINGSRNYLSTLAQYDLSDEIWKFFTSTAERMRIDSSGNVGIGTTSPSERLEVAGKIKTTSGGVEFPDGTVQTSAASAGITTGKAIAMAIVFG